MNIGKGKWLIALAIAGVALAGTAHAGQQRIRPIKAFEATCHLEAWGTTLLDGACEIEPFSSRRWGEVSGLPGAVTQHFSPLQINGLIASGDGNAVGIVYPSPGNILGLPPNELTGMSHLPHGVDTGPFLNNIQPKGKNCWRADISQSKDGQVILCWWRK